MPARQRDHYRGDYNRRARAVRQAAWLNPDTRCWQCGRTQAEHGRKWQAGHVIDGQANSLLRPECEPCNTSRGATRGNRMRGQGTTRDW